MATITPTRTNTAMTEGGEIFRLMTWLSPSYPVGAFSYSHGIEYAVEIGAVSDWRSLAEWVDYILRHGAGHVDACLLAAAYRAALNGDEALEDVRAIAACWRGSREMALESLQQGRSFLLATLAAWPSEILQRFMAALDQREVAYPVAVGIAAAGAGLTLPPTLQAYLQAFAANLVSAAVRLIPLGQTDGQRALSSLRPAAEALAEQALEARLDRIGSSAMMVDWASMMHETQYTRLFRS